MAGNKTVDPKLAYLDLANSVDFQKKFTSFTTVAEEFLTELEASYDHHTSFVNPDPITAEADFFVNLNNILLVNFDSNFVSFWIDKYNTAHNAVKDKIQETLGSDNVFFRPFSESMGHLRHSDFVKDRSTQPIFDTDSAVLDIPSQYAGSTEKILDHQTKITTQYMSKLSTAVFRQNIKELGEPQKMEDDGTTKQQLVYSAQNFEYSLLLTIF